MQNFLFYLSKIARPFLLSPIFICTALAVVALIALPAPTKFRRFLKSAAFWACGLLAVLSLPVVSSGLARAWEPPRGSTAELGKTGPYDAIVVLGGCISPRASTAEHLELNDAAERLVAAAKLHRLGIAPIVLYTGGSGDIADQSMKEAPYAGAFLEFLGVPKDRIILESESRNTYENATLSKPPLVAAGAKRVVLVTSAWHMRRSAAIFRKADYDFVPYAADSLVEPFTPYRDFAPDAYALEKSTRILREWVGFTAYWALGRL